ncbi:hypothetical protein HII31_01983 [Pseudocercospora fuligena]|uniref:Uncharacterized protein n=1 Tax=Pseudocercospora fuligena TaxID=685502 RepID=A0A8H6RTI0_9PEZI|nr:hypothetical protein HII31_01983 [Pseudocercospora fuligena]
MGRSPLAFRNIVNRESGPDPPKDNEARKRFRPRRCSHAARHHDTTCAEDSLVSFTACWLTTLRGKRMASCRAEHFLPLPETTRAEETADIAFRAEDQTTSDCSLYRMSLEHSDGSGVVTQDGEVRRTRKLQVSLKTAHRLVSRSSQTLDCFDGTILKPQDWGSLPSALSYHGTQCQCYPALRGKWSSPTLTA